MNLLAASAVLAVAAPGWASLLGLAWGRSRASSVTIGVLGAAIALVAAIAEAAATWTGGDTTSSVRLLGSAEIGPFVVQLAVRADALSGLVAVAVALVALCVQIYSAGYLTDRYRPYAATVSLFTAAMMLVVHVDDLVLLLIGWEVMSICSYLLIGHHSDRQAARAAALKAFLVTQVGDVGFLLGVVALMAGAGTSSLTELVAAAGSGALPAGTATVGSLLLLAGVVGKSAQFPLHTWLPDAMEGPTPISALIHAATMVAAGVFVVARLYPLFATAPVTLAVLGLVAAVTMLGAALAALAQDDLKRLLAWSTISQVALMLSALAVGSTGEATGHGRSAAVAHLLSHAGFKALLFLAAGCVTHLVGSTLLRDMAGLRHRAPLVAWTFAIGLAALAGLPPTSGFVSKESALGAAEAAALHPGASSGLSAAVAWVVLVAGLATTVVTATYATRAFVVVVLGPAGDDAEHGHLPRALSWPLVVLAVPSLALGVLFWTRPAVLGGFELGWVTAVVGTVLALGGVALGWAAAARSPARDAADALPRAVRSFLAQGYRTDEAQAWLVVRPVRRLAQLVATGDDDVVDAYVRGSATGSAWAGRLLRHVQSGAVSGYLTWALGAAVLLGIGVVAW